MSNISVNHVTGFRLLALQTGCAQTCKTDHQKRSSSHNI